MNLDNIWQAINSTAQNVGAVNGNIETLIDDVAALTTATNNLTTATNNLTAATGFGIPTSATVVTASSGNVAASSAVATIAAVSSVRNYIRGFSIRSSGATSAAVVTVTVAGVIGGTMSFAYPTVAGVTTTNAPLDIMFPFPIPASAVNTAIVVTLPSLGTGNTNATVVAYGFKI